MRPIGLALATFCGVAELSSSSRHRICWEGAEFQGG